MRIMIAVAGVLCAVGASFGHDEIKWTGDEPNDDLWTTPANWDLDRVPVATDRVIVDSGTGNPVIEATRSITVETVVIGTANELIIEADATNQGSLTLTNHICGLVPACGFFNSVVDGSIVLEKDAILAFATNSHTITGDGHIICIERGGADITIAEDLFLRNELDHWNTGAGEHGGIRGILTIHGPGKIINDGNIEAVGVVGDAQYDSIVVGAITEDTDNGRWIVNCESILVFTKSACLEGKYEANGSYPNSIGGTFTFGFNVLLYTLGDFIHGCSFGLIKGAGAEFGFGGQPTGDCDVDTNSATKCGETLDVATEYPGVGALCVVG